MTQEQILPTNFILRRTRPGRVEWAAHLKRLPRHARRWSISQAIWVGCYADSKPGTCYRPRDAFFRALSRRQSA